MIRAVLFDCDGTLVDSEGQTDAAIVEVMARYGVPNATLPPNETRGRTWGDVVTALQARYAAAVAGVDARTLHDALVATWGASLDGFEEIPGAAAAVRACAQTAMVAVVSSSPRDLVVRILEKLHVRDVVHAVVGAEDVVRPKPDPACFLEGAARCYVDPRHCLVVEDSRAGLVAARAAGMQTRLVLHRCAEPDLCRPLADEAFEHYSALPESFWRDLLARR